LCVGEGVWTTLTTSVSSRIARPTGVALHLLGAELVARGLDGFTPAAPPIAPRHQEIAPTKWTSTSDATTSVNSPG
jgi:hypothetical protein